MPRESKRTEDEGTGLRGRGGRERVSVGSVAPRAAAASSTVGDFALYKSTIPGSAPPVPPLDRRSQPPAGLASADRKLAGGSSGEGEMDEVLTVEVAVGACAGARVSLCARGRAGRSRGTLHHHGEVGESERERAAHLWRSMTTTRCVEGSVRDSSSAARAPASEEGGWSASAAQFAAGGRRRRGGAHLRSSRRG